MSTAPELTSIRSRASTRLFACLGLTALILGACGPTSGCGPDSETPPPDPPPPPTAGTETSRPYRPISTRVRAAGCTGQRWVGRRPTKPEKREEPPQDWDWNEAPLFDKATEASELGRYRVFTWKGKDQFGTRSLESLDEVARKARKIEALDEDCALIGPLTPVDDAFRTWERDAFRRRTLSQLATPRGDARIHIAILDSSPDSGSGPIVRGKSEHGYAMAAIANQLFCGGSERCAADMSSHLALSHGREGVSPEGGYVGTPAELAQAIHRAVDGWKGLRGEQPRLVINLSVGWQPGNAPTADAASGSVLAALEHAACHGALVIAAAGNDPGGDHVPGAVFPAAWEGVSAPTEEQCRVREKGTDYGKFLESATLPIFTAPAAKVKSSVVYSIGGTANDHAPILATRQKSLRRFAAPAQLATAGDVDKALPLALTGTSVAAAVASGTAAAVWAHQPALTPAEVMRLLYDTGPVVKQFSSNSSLYAGSPEEVHEISRCSAVHRACPKCGGLALSCVQTAGLLQQIVTTPPQRTVIDDWVALMPKSSDAPGPALSALAWTPVQSMLVPPWVHPQPSDPVCGPSCLLDWLRSTRRLAVSIEPAFDGQLHNMWLTVRFSDSSITSLEPAPSLVLEGDDDRSFEFWLDAPENETPVEAQLTWIVIKEGESPMTLQETIALAIE